MRKILESALGNTPLNERVAEWYWKSKDIIVLENHFCVIIKLLKLCLILCLFYCVKIVLRPHLWHTPLLTFKSKVRNKQPVDLKIYTRVYLSFLVCVWVYKESPTNWPQIKIVAYPCFKAVFRSYLFFKLKTLNSF